MHKIHKFACVSLALMALVPLSLSETNAAQTNSLQQHIAGALAVAGISVHESQIDVLAGVANAGENANLTVVTASKGTGSTIRVKLRCRDNRECLPFYVLVRGVDRKIASLSAARLMPAIEEAPVQNIVRGGEHATLILESPDSRMSLPVICLQSGTMGQKIRVSSPDHRQFYDAEVVAVGILKGSL